MVYNATEMYRLEYQILPDQYQVKEFKISRGPNERCSLRAVRAFDGEDDIRMVHNGVRLSRFEVSDWMAWVRSLISSSPTQAKSLMRDTGS